MKLADCLHAELVALGVEAADKTTLLRLMAERFAAHHDELDAETLLERFIERESVGPTSLGKGLALPHARIPKLEGLASVGIARLAEPLDWPGIDKQPVSLAIFSVVDENARQLHLQMLARLSRILNHEENREALMAAATPEDALAVFATPAKPATDKKSTER